MIELNRAISIVGSQGALASALGVVQSAVSNWLRRGSVPAEYCPKIEAVTGGLVTCEGLRPDVCWSVVRGVAKPNESSDFPAANRPRPVSQAPMQVQSDTSIPAVIAASALANGVRAHGNS